MCFSSALLQTHAEMHEQTHTHINMLLTHTTKWVTLVYTPNFCSFLALKTIKHTQDLNISFYVSVKLAV